MARWGQGLLGDVQVLHHGLHQPAAVVGVVDGEVGRVAQPVPVPAQNAGTAGVEGGGPHVAALGAQHLGEAVFQLPGGLVGKGDGHDPPGGAGGDGQPGPDHVGEGGVPLYIVPAGVLVLGGEEEVIAVVGPAVADDIGDAVDQHRGLAGARTGQHQQGALGGEHRLFLAVVHPGKVTLQHLAAQGGQVLFRWFHGNTSFWEKFRGFAPHSTTKIEKREAPFDFPGATRVNWEKKNRRGASQGGDSHGTGGAGDFTVGQSRGGVFHPRVGGAAGHPPVYGPGDFLFERQPGVFPAGAGGQPADQLHDQQLCKERGAAPPRTRRSTARSTWRP